MLTVTQPIIPDFEKFASYLQIAFSERRFTNNGPLLCLLELRLRELVAARNLILVSNGTIALQLALQALGVKGEVITTPFTFCATTHSIIWAGAQPVFVDIDPHNLTIDPALIEASITPRTEAILGVHVYGRICDVDAIQKIADKHGLAVVYDAAHSFNTAFRGTPIGHFGNAVAYSFHATKMFHTGEGGAVETSSSVLAEKLRGLRNFGIESEDSITQCGTNAKMSELSAAMGLAVLFKIGEEGRARANLRNLYNQALSDIPGITLFPGPEDSATDIYYIIRFNAENVHLRDQAQALLKRQGVLTRKYFYPLTCDGAFGSSERQATVFPVARQASRDVLALPFHSEVSERDVENIANVLRSVLEPD
jgi:dTDP-4-amino-4,6-dideoxygalactose transaminase